MFCPRTVADTCGQFADTSENHAVSRLPVGKPAIMSLRVAHSVSVAFSKPTASAHHYRSRGLCACFEASMDLQTFRKCQQHSGRPVPSLANLAASKLPLWSKVAPLAWNASPQSLEGSATHARISEMRPLVLAFGCSFSTKSLSHQNVAVANAKIYPKKQIFSCMFCHMRKKVLKTSLFHK